MLLAPAASIVKHQTVMLRICLASIFLFPSLLFADDFDEPVSDKKVERDFQQQLTALLESGKTADSDQLRKQLTDRGSTDVALPAPPKGEHDPESLYDACKDGVLCFGNIYKCDRCDKWHSNIAGGFVITSDGLAVTNYHVMNNSKAAAFGAMTRSGKFFPVKEVVAASRRDDLAIVRLEGEGFAPLPVAEGDSVGADVTVISHPEGRFYTVSTGIISRYFKVRGGEHSGSPRLAITADYARGSSGSPVINDDGAVVGVVESTSSIYYEKKDGRSENLQMVVKSCIPSGSIRKLLSGGEKPD